MQKNTHSKHKYNNMRTENNNMIIMLINPLYTASKHNHKSVQLHYNKPNLYVLLLA